MKYTLPRPKIKENHEETFLFIIFSFESLYLQLQIFCNRNRSYDIAHDENAMSSLIIQSIQQGQVKNSYRCSQKCCNINRKIPVQETLFNKELMRLQHRCLLGNIAEFLRSPVLKNVCERLLLPDVTYSAFAQSIVLKYLFQNKNIKIFSKIVYLKKNICSFHVMFM